MPLAPTPTRHLLPQRLKVLGHVAFHILDFTRRHVILEYLEDRPRHLLRIAVDTADQVLANPIEEGRQVAFAGGRLARIRAVLT